MQIQRGICRVSLVVFLSFFQPNNLSASEGFCSRIVDAFMGSTLGKQSEIDRAKRENIFKYWTRMDFENAITSRYKLDGDSLLLLFVEGLKKYYLDFSSYAEQSADLSLSTSMEFNSQLAQFLSAIDHRFYRSSQMSGFKPSLELLTEFSKMLQKVKLTLEALQPQRPSDREPAPDLTWTSGITLEEEARYRFKNSKWLNYYQTVAANAAGLQSIHWILGRLDSFRRL